MNARDRIGNGPWYNARGQMIGQNVAQLHGDTIEQARVGNILGKQMSLTEKQGIVNGVGDMPNQHDMLTGSMLTARHTDAADHTCNNWTANTTAQRAARPLGQAGRQQLLNSAHGSRRLQPAESWYGGAGYLLLRSELGKDVLTFSSSFAPYSTTSCDAAVWTLPRRDPSVVDPSPVSPSTSRSSAPWSRRTWIR